ncbi:MAG TPA: TIGR04222 domain-containing membrane protein [Kofleriaceae bacterium]|nr:TIGR04222 domain-containing membrane protein [Kofleriaceae bacterium]
MNPFDLRGPEFLLFYAALGGVLLVAHVLVRRWTEGGPPGKVDLSDPYLIVLVRADRDEAVRVALVNLVERGIVAPGVGHWQVVSGAEEAARHPLERAVIEYLRPGVEPDVPRIRVQASGVLDDLERELERRDLLAGPRRRAARALRTAAIATALGGVAACKIAVALQRGRHNISLLIVLAVVAVYAAVKLRGGRVTGRGKRLVRDLQRLMGRARDRLAQARQDAGGEPRPEIPLLAAVFGLVALPAVAFPHAALLAPARPTWWSAGSSGGTASSCGGGASCSGGCGGGCGGGGCGGCGS